MLFAKGPMELTAYPAGLKDTSYTVPEGIVSIADYAFTGCALEEVIFPSTLTGLGKHAFEDAQSLRSVTVPGSVSEVPSFCFAGCSNLETVTIEAGVTRIGPKAFGSGKLTEITLPDGVKELSSNAFSECTALTAIHVPASVETIGNGAIPQSATVYGKVDSVAWEYALKTGCAFVEE